MTNTERNQIIRKMYAAETELADLEAEMRDEIEMFDLRTANADVEKIAELSERFERANAYTMSKIEELTAVITECEAALN